MSITQDINKTELEYIIQHIVLPPRLPQDAVADPRQHHHNLLRFLTQVAQEHAADIKSSKSHNSALRRVTKSLELTLRLHDVHADLAENLRNAIRRLSLGDSFALHVSAQNAGIIIRRVMDTLQFEVFEASPVPEAVVNCKGSLKCSFPGPATAIPWEVATNPDFLKELGAFLSQMDKHEFNETVTKTRKGGNNLSETRSTNNPKYIIELFTGMMRGIGKEIKVDRIEKNVRDEVNWYSAQNPWRRSPLWLIVRVMLQTMMTRTEYKCFMLGIIRFVLSKAIEFTFDTYILSCVSKKLARRVHKVGDASIPGTLLSRILETIQEASRIKSERWESTISDMGTDATLNPELATYFNIRENTQLDLEKASAWVTERISTYSNPAPPYIGVDDPIEMRRQSSKYFFPEISIPPDCSEWDRASTLIDFENWIKDHLDDYCQRLRSLSGSSSLIDTLPKAIERYHDAAKSFYENNDILNNSIMLLTIFELWVQLDKTCCEKEPLLLKYSPEIPHNVLDPILLVQREDMERLCRVENHIKERETQSKNGSIYDSTSNRNSFSYLYYDTSTDLKQLRDKIITRAQIARRAKEKELKEKNEEHANLMASWTSAQCEFRETFKRGKYKQKHLPKCEKCAFQKQAKKMKITAHEWPLPQVEEYARLVVFELQTPQAFLVWRNATYYIMVDVCIENTRERPKDSQHWGMDCWTDLSIHQKVAQRVTFVSEAKPIATNSHYSSRKIPAEASDVLVKHAGVYRLFDKRKAEWVDGRHKSRSLDSLCQSQVSDPAYNALTYAIYSTQHTHNQVIAEQYRCHLSLTLREYEAFASLRSGRMLQWHNILLELQKLDLSFKKDSVFSLILHASCHVGPRGESSDADWKRESHVALADRILSTELLKIIDHTLDVIKDNWEQANTLKTLVLLSRRLLSCGHKVIQYGTLRCLRKARKSCRPWIENIQSKLEAASEGSNVEYFRTWLLRILSIQCSTFEVDGHLLHAAFEEREDLVDFLVVQNLIFDNSIGITSKFPYDLKLSLGSNRRFAIVAEAFIETALKNENGIISTALNLILPTQPVSGIWEKLSERSQQWWKLEMTAHDGQNSTIIHFNPIQGRLLINGKLSGRLPEKYFNHRDYKKLLGNRILDVIPSCFSDMSYQSKNKIHGAVLHFEYNEPDLIIRKDDGEIHEFIPAAMFEGDIPKPIYLTGSQWLNFSQGNIRFHQKHFWWKKESSDEDWILTKRIGHWLMTKRKAKLLNIHDNIYLAMRRIFSPIESRDYIIGTSTDDDIVVDIDLPRYKLQFFINSEQKIESRTFREWIFDEDQKLGTFIGLKTFIKLKSKLSDPEKASIIVPYGNIVSQIASTDSHQTIYIDPGDGDRSYTIFNVDRILNRVIDDGSLEARYTRLYLHALCSGILRDPLTGRSGVEEALEGLRNATSFSFQTLCEKEVLVLNKIARLTPFRAYYPDHLRLMQQTRWQQNLPIWVQNDLFYYVVKDILDDWNRRQFLIKDSLRYTLPERGSRDLLERARNRNSIFWAGDPFHSQRKLGSSPHNPRHLITESETYVEEMARASFAWSPHQDLRSDILQSFRMRNDLPGFNNKLVLGYCPEWIDADPNTEWCTLYELCRRSTRYDRFSILFIFCYFVYKNRYNQKLLKSLLAVAASGNFSDLEVPGYNHFELNIGDSPIHSVVEHLIAKSVIPYWKSSYADLPRLHNENDGNYYERRHEEYSSALEVQIDLLTNHIMNQWPTSFPEVIGVQETPLLRISESATSVITIFENCFRNLTLFEHFAQVDERLHTLKTVAVPRRTFAISTLYAYTINIESPSQLRQTPSIVSLAGLISRDSPPKDRYMETTLPFERNQINTDLAQMDGIESVRSMIKRLRSTNDAFADTYATDMLKSFEALRKLLSSQDRFDMTISSRALLSYKEETQVKVDNLYTEILKKLAPISKSELALRLAGLWPSLSKLDILQQLCIQNRGTLDKYWSHTIIKFGEAITLYQRAERLLQLHRVNLKLEFQREIRNNGRQNWKTEDYIDWLLLEIDSGMLIRPIQAEIGLSMMDDTKDNSVVMQLNMGEGKSAVIVPAVAAALANTKILTRSVVLKPLANQMFQILVQRLSGLCNRKIYFLPFSRELKLCGSEVEDIKSLFVECMAEGAILLALPEHILSFKLMGLERMIRGDIETAAPLLDTQNWLESHTRDILDESDEILHFKYQLIYTMGQQRTLEGSTCRWTTIQEVFDLLQARIGQWAARTPDAVEIMALEPPMFPRIRIIDKSKGIDFFFGIAKEICLDNLDSIPSMSSKLKLFTPRLRQLAFQFISTKDISIQDQDELLAACDSLKVQLLIMRGLIAYGVLLFVLRDKRYRVDYGLDLVTRRSRLAVPYKAKDQPSVKAEFGHPEVTLALTCLTYYYSGLENSDLSNCFDLLLKADDPDLTYERWTKRQPKICKTLSSLQGLNLFDPDQVSKVYETFRFNKDVIDFYLSEIVFPREAKEFPNKLLTSGWDIAERKTNNTTGFSGTNDNRYLLPTSIRQLDLPQELHTNSLVLVNILRKENNTVIRGNNARDKAMDTLRLTVVQSPKIQVLLDVGATILELNNEQVAREWLRLDQSPNILGVVFFGVGDELLVMRRDQKIELFRSSALSYQLDRVLVYLDEAHTRGTDLKLPTNSRAVVTLGPNLAKDKFVQGCMRMRKLGKGHSLAFIASPDIYSQIQKEAGKGGTDAISVSDVLFWTMRESCRQIEHGFPIWADQGLRYLKRMVVKNKITSAGDASKLKSGLMEVEGRSLLEMYGVSVHEDPDYLGLPPEVQIIQNRLTEFQIKLSYNTGVQEEQEREVDHEMEQENILERPKAAQPREHYLHPKVLSLARFGQFQNFEDAFKPAFSVFKNTSSRRSLEAAAWQSNLYVTYDFQITVKQFPGDDMDDYLRPVRWIMSARNGSSLAFIIISPWEANKLMPVFRSSTVSQLHCYAPKTSRNTPTLEFLDFCNVPSMMVHHEYPVRFPITDITTRIAINTFAGQLFFQNMDYYTQLREFLGICYDDLSEDFQRDQDGWLSQDTWNKLSRKASKSSPVTGCFSRNPIPFLTEILSMRRKGQGFDSTHFGKLINARLLQTDDFA